MSGGHKRAFRFALTGSLTRNQRLEYRAAERLIVPKSPARSWKGYIAGEDTRNQTDAGMKRNVVKPR